MNWTRERLKTNGKIAFKKNYWACVAVAVIMGIITGLSSISGGRTGSGAHRTVCMGMTGFHSHIITDGDSHLQGWQLQWLRLY